ncbi:MAG: transglutaminase family protein [Candidatus Thorarchaeota archaeon]
MLITCQIFTNAIPLNLNATKSSDSSTTQLYLHEWLGSLTLQGEYTSGNFQVYVHIPVQTVNQAPIMISDVRTIPTDRVTNYKIIKGYSGQNALLKVTIEKINRYETLELVWKSYTLVKRLDYSDLPNSQELVPENSYSDKIKQWLAASDFIQSDHEEIIATAKMLSENTSDIITIVDNVVEYTSTNITYEGGGWQDALNVLRLGYGVCTGKANLAAALLRSCGIPTRVLMVYTTHYIVEYYLYSYGWVQAESTLGINPYIRDISDDTICFTTFIEDETNQSVINGQSPYGGVIFYIGTSTDNVSWGINYNHWNREVSQSFVVDTTEINTIMGITKSIWNYYCLYGGSIPSDVNGSIALAVDYQTQALLSLKSGDQANYLHFLRKSYYEYFKYKDYKKKSRGLAIGSTMIKNRAGEIENILDFIKQCNINMVIIDFGWITASWNLSNFEDIGTLIHNLNKVGITVWLMYRCRTLSSDNYELRHQIHITGEEDGEELCYTDERCLQWTIDWADALLNQYSDYVEGMILYNPRIWPDCCYCDHCIESFQAETGIITDPKSLNESSYEYECWLQWKAESLNMFIQGWRNSLNNNWPILKTGVIVNSPEYSAYFSQNVTAIGDCSDILCPFIPLHNVQENDFGREICDDTKKCVNCDVIGNIKIYGPYNNTDSDIINAMTSIVSSTADGYFIWSYDYLNPFFYDFESIINAYNGILYIPEITSSSLTTTHHLSTTPEVITSTSSISHKSEGINILITSLILTLIIFRKRKKLQEENHL